MAICVGPPKFLIGLHNLKSTFKQVVGKLVYMNKSMFGVSFFEVTEHILHEVASIFYFSCPWSNLLYVIAIELHIGVWVNHPALIPVSSSMSPHWLPGIPIRLSEFSSDNNFSMETCVCASTHLIELHYFTGSLLQSAYCFLIYLYICLSLLPKQWAPWVRILCYLSLSSSWLEFYNLATASKISLLWREMYLFPQPTSYIFVCLFFL